MFTEDEEGVDVLGMVLTTQRQERREEVELARPMLEYAQLVPEPGVGPLRFEDFPYQREWYSDEVANAEEVVWRKSTQVGMCLAPWTRVLMADLSWQRIDALEVGDELMGVDEDAQAGGRRLRKAMVTAKWETNRPCRHVLFGDGRDLVMSPDHRMLVQRGQRAGTNLAWRAADRLRVGQRLRSVVLPPMGVTDDFEDGWMAGLLDGEGCLRNRAAGAEVVITQQLVPVYDRAVRYLRERGYAFGERVQDNGVARITIGRGHDVLRLLSATDPSRFAGRDWWSGMRVPGTCGTGSQAIESIEDDDELMPMVDIETTTGAFIAEGFISHNSAYAWRWATRQADQFGDTVVYIFPADAHVTEFGDERIEPAIEESAYLRARILPRFVRHKRLKRIGRGFLHLRGSNSKAGAQSVAAQCLVFDEYDFLDQTNLPQIERRISGARQIGKNPRVRRLGTPTIEGDGISAAYASSDQRVWIVMCDECDHEQEVTWEESVRWRNAPGGEVMRAGRDVYDDPGHVEAAWRECKRCHEEINVKHGRWVAQQPDRSVIGYYASRLNVPHTDLKQIVRASRRTRPADVEAFENNDLGRPYSGAEAGLDMPALLAACELGGAMADFYRGGNPVTMGIDVAGERALTVRIDEQLPAESPQIPNPRRALWIGEVKDFNDIVALVHRFAPVVVAIDSNPERRMAKALRSTFAPGRVVLVEYDDRNEAESMKVTTGEVGTMLDGVPLKVRVNRTEAIDAMMDSIRQLRNLPLANPPPKWFDQMRSPRRKTELDSRGRAKRVYVKTGTQGDDYAHADVYALVATELWRMRGGANAMMHSERPLPDEELGFERVRLAGDNPAIYSPGFNERDLLR